MDEPVLTGHLFSRIADAALDDPNKFSEQALQALCEHFPLKAASFYSFNKHQSSLILRAQHGLRYDLYRSFSLGLDTPAGDGIRRSATVVFDNISSDSRYLDRGLINTFKLSGLVVVPLLQNGVRRIDTPSPLGVLCLYPHPSDNLARIAATAEAVAAFFAKLYLASVEQKRLHLRSALVHLLGSSTDIGSLMHKAVRLLQSRLAADAVSVFIGDPINNFLRLSGTTGLPSGVKKEQVFFGTNSLDPTYLSFRDNKLRAELLAEMRLDQDVPLDVCASKPFSCVICPIEAPSKDGNAVGVIRAINGHVRHGNVSHLTAFGWEEVATVAFFGEMLGVLVHFLRTGVKAEYDFNRRMHGAKNNLQAAINHLQLLERRGNIGDHLPEDLRYSLPNAISFLSDIRAQIYRLEMRHLDLVLEPVELYGKVLSKIPPFVQRAARAAGMPPFRLTKMNETGFDKLPPVSGNVDALFSVFRNVADNAVKYAHAFPPHMLHFSHELTETHVVVSVTDGGIGIPSEWRDLIFVEGSRVPAAVARCPSGTGMGLADCRELLASMGGSIRCVPGQPGTTFEISLPIWKGNDL